MLEAPAGSKILTDLFLFFEGSRASIFAHRWALQCWNIYTGLALGECKCKKCHFAIWARKPYFNFLESSCLWCFAKFDRTAFFLADVMTQNMEWRKHFGPKFDCFWQQLVTLVVFATYQCCPYWSVALQDQNKIYRLLSVSEPLRAITWLLRRITLRASKIPCNVILGFWNR